jgi:protease I
MDASLPIIALLLEDHFDEQEFIYPYYRVQEAGFKPLVVALEAKTYAGKTGFTFAADAAAADVDTSQLAAVIVPGGYAPDRVRRYPKMLKIVQDVNEAGRPVGSICHASWVIISAKIVAGRMLTGHPSTRDDLENAGAHYSTERVVVDSNLVTAQHYRDLPMFMKAFLERF